MYDTGFVTVPACVRRCCPLYAVVNINLRCFGLCDDVSPAVQGSVKKNFLQSSCIVHRCCPLYADVKTSLRVCGSIALCMQS